MPPAAPSLPPGPTATPIRAVLVGVSGYGRWHLLMAMEQALLGRLRLVGAVIINPREQAAVCRRLERLGVPIFADFDRMLGALAGGIDLLLLPTAIQWHAPMAIAGLRAGAHILVEKPLAATVQDADAIMAAQREAGRLVAVGFQDLYVPLTQSLKQRLLAGEIGRLRRIVVRGQWPRSSSYYRRNGWAGRLRANGDWVLDSPVSNAFAHFLMLALFWAGDRPETVARLAALEAELYRTGMSENFDTACLRATTTEGVEILFYGTHANAEESAPEVRLIADTGSVTWSYERTCTIHRDARPPETVPVPDQLDTRLHVLDAVLDRLAGKSRFVVEPALAREHTRLVNALHDCFPVHTVAPEHLDFRQGGGGEARQIRGLDALIDLAAGRGVLFGEIGPPWSRPASGPCDVRGYAAFRGGAA